MNIFHLVYIECRHHCKPAHCSNPCCKEIVTNNKCNGCNIFKIEFTTVEGVLHLLQKKVHDRDTVLIV